ncbi:laccase domain-containing protein [Candidatus Parcubacteria bacterium]|nr:laccase domain-containing protein [Candidatus Parcubacteria bacterium]
MTLDIPLFGNEVRLFLLGKPTDWRLVDPNDKEKKFRQEVGKEIAKLLMDWGVGTVLAPTPSFNAEVCSFKDLKDITEVRQKNGPLVRFHRGFSADGIVVEKGQADFLPSGDCPMLIVYDPTVPKLVCAHAGRECLYDLGRYGRDEPRQYASIVDAVIAQFQKKNRPMLKAHVTLGIAGRNFSHPIKDPKYGERNRHMLKQLGLYEEALDSPSDEGRLSLYKVIYGQLRAHGVDKDRITLDNADTYSDSQQMGFAWWSHRRFKEKNESVDGRNGVLVVHHG